MLCIIRGFRQFGNSPQALLFYAPSRNSQVLWAYQSAAEIRVIDLRPHSRLTQLCFVLKTENCKKIAQTFSHSHQKCSTKMLFGSGQRVKINSRHFTCKKNLNSICLCPYTCLKLKWYSNPLDRDRVFFFF